MQAKVVHLIELTLSSEKVIEEAFRHKNGKYSGLSAECQEAGWKTTIYTVEVGCGGFLSRSTTWRLKDVGLTGSKLRKVTKICQRRQKKVVFGSVSESRQGH